MISVLVYQVAVTIVIFVFVVICLTALYSKIGSVLNNISTWILLVIGSVLSVFGVVSLLIDVWT